MQDSPTKLCTRDDGRPVRARGLCGTHYNQEYQPGRHKKTEMLCGWCERPCAKAADVRYAKRFCSLECRDTFRRRDLLPVPYRGVIARGRQQQAAPEATRPPGRWVAGWCRTCGAAFVDNQLQARSCSERCTRRYWRDRYADDVPETIRAYVFERDGWRCQICKRGIPALLVVPHHLAATVDHIVPRSEGGTHDPANLRAAHFICNTRRNNRGGNEQLALIG